MGTDVHGVFQARKNGKWEDVPHKWEQNRHYLLFAWLADVRNGYGFAGVPTHSPVKPIAEPKGLPADFVMDGDSHPTILSAVDNRRREYMDAEERDNPSVWMGDHSHSYLSADEILAAQLPNIWRTGVVSRAVFDAWDGVSAPNDWAGDVSGSKVIVANTPAEVGDDTTHVRVYWRTGADELDYFVTEVKRLQELHGDVRLVFGFDS